MKDSILDTLKQCFEDILPKRDDRSLLSPLEFVTYLMFSYIEDTRQASLEAIRRGMKEQSNKNISRSAFWERLATKRLKSFLERIIESLMMQLSIPVMGGTNWLDALGVRNIWVMDSCTFTLRDGSRENYPGTGSAAGIKWHSCFDLSNGKAVWYEFSSSAEHDSKHFPDLKNIRNILLVFDLGYWDYSLLWSIAESKGFFLSRIKSNAKIIIKEVIQGMSVKKYIGSSLLSIVHSRKKGNIIEVIIEKPCGNKAVEKKDKILTCRAIGFWNPVEKSYYWYLTNLEVNACVIYPLYRFRWQIELIFKSCKQSFNASRLTSNNPLVTESLLLATIASKLVSSVILHVSLPGLNKAEQLAISHQRIAKIMVQIGRHFVNFLIEKEKCYSEILMNKIKLFTNEIFDPNHHHRKTSLGRINEILLNST